MDQVLEVALAKGTRAKRRLQVALSAKRPAASSKHMNFAATAPEVRYHV
jgi:hypothetical protein